MMTRSLRAEVWKLPYVANKVANKPRNPIGLLYEKKKPTRISPRNRYMIFRLTLNAAVRDRAPIVRYRTPGAALPRMKKWQALTMADPDNQRSMERRDFN
jgi:hypothetical protein